MKHLLTIFASILFAIGVFAIVPDFDDDSDVRENPDLGTESDSAESGKTDYSRYPYLRLADNWINLNGDNWSDLQIRFANIDDTVVSIVHIGDSHIQAEGSTSVTRRRLQSRYGSAGRGLITPYRLAGTNQPVDYTITCDAPLTTAKLLKQPWATDMGFTGISISPKTRDFDISIATNARDDQDLSFDYIKIYTHGNLPTIVGVSSPTEANLRFSTIINCDTINVWLNEPVTNITLQMHTSGSCNIYGFKLENSMMGLEYNAIGNNGATFSSYNSIGTLGADLTSLSPNLIIISLGANEAFGNVSDQMMYNNIKLLVSDIKHHNPDAHILLTTPAECQRSTSKRRARKKTYAVNTNIKRLRDVILRYGSENNIPTYDWYLVAGGDGSSAKWLNDGLLSKDRIHCTWSGYALMGDLLYDSLINAVEK